jgi:hypothetical protein
MGVTNLKYSSNFDTYVGSIALIIIAIIGVPALGIIARHRGETFNALWFVVSRSDTSADQATQSISSRNNSSKLHRGLCRLYVLAPKNIARK